jgi:hypothetical protein
MSTKLLYLALCAVSTLSLLLPGHALADDCLSCHAKNGVTVRVPQTEPIRIMADGKEHQINLAQGFKFHGHECPGMTTAFVAIRHGIKLLFGDTLPDRNDLLITSVTPAGGVKDMIDLIMKGDSPSDRTWAPPGMKPDIHGFMFTLIRKSTSEIVEIKLKPTLFPDDFYQLKQKQKSKKSTAEEDQRLHGYIKNMILTFPSRPAKELFGTPKPYKVILWGTVQDGEMDRHIRKLRQIEKQKQLQN